MVRFKSRYFLCEIVFENPESRQWMEDKNVFKAVKDAIVQTHGDFGHSCCALRLIVKYLNAYTGIALLRCRKEFYRMLWSALPFITFLENKNQKYPCFFNTLHVGGTIRTSQKFLIQYNRKQLQFLLKDCTTDAERNSIQKSILSCSFKWPKDVHPQHRDDEMEDDDTE
uniref:Ribonuclease P/MRP protein subunit POP5 n=1 Tax=Callorhinchus milii TaxID=7868 RepID=V9LB12_CALMI